MKRSDAGSNGDRRGAPPAGFKGRSWWAWARLVLLAATMAGVSAFILVRQSLPIGQEVLEEGDIAAEDVRAPQTMAYESAILLEREQEQAAARVEPTYTRPEPGLARRQLERARDVLDFLGSVRADPLASTAQKRRWILAVDELADLDPETLDALLALSDESWDRVQLEVQNVLDQAMRRAIRESNIQETRETTVPSLVRLDLTDQEAAVTTALVQHFLVPNSFHDAAATAAAQAAARERVREEVELVLRRFKEGEVIVREGERVDALELEALERLGVQQTEVRWTDAAGEVLLAIVGTVLLYLFLARFQPEVLWRGQKLFLLTLLVVVFVVAVGVMVPGSSVLRYLAPIPALAMLATAALGPYVGLVTTAFMGGVVGVIADNSLEMAVFGLLGGVAATLTMRRVERIVVLFRAGLLAALAHVVVLLVFRFPQDVTQLGNLTVPILVSIVNGAISASLALGSLFLVGPLFDITTTVRLIELSRPEHPLLQRLLREAPATYHHSLMVANLAEQAAERIGADPLLSRIGAYYHDIGKVMRPYFFSENQVEGVNPHDRLDPLASVEVLVAHVEDGLALARRYRLPQRVRAFIPEHHGTNRVSFLYQKALELWGEDAEIDESAFHYPGPRPQSKETALVMLADGCSAAVRAARPTSAEEVAEIVDRVVSQRRDDGQLNESGLTLQDLEIIRQTFASALKGVYHPRIQYPQSERVAAPVAGGGS